jgi:hypothetical protein
MTEIERELRQLESERDSLLKTLEEINEKAKAIGFCTEEYCSKLLLTFEELMKLRERVRKEMIHRQEREQLTAPGNKEGRDE